MGVYTVREAKPEEQRELTRLCVRATMHSGYDEEFIDRSMPSLTITLPEISGDFVRVAQDNLYEVVGVVCVMPTALQGIALLHGLFVDPARWKRGIGRVLFGAAVARAKGMKAGAIMIYANPSAEGFYLAWGEVQIAQYRAQHPNGTMARLAMELMLNIAARRHDAHLIGRQHLKNGCLTWRPSKTSGTTGKVLTIRVVPELQAALDAMPKRDALTFLLTEYGQPFKSAAAFGNKFADWCDAVGFEPVLRPDGKTRNYRAHGLRHAALHQLAHAGCTGPEIMAVSGHSSLSQVQVYLNGVEQERLAEAAMDKRAGSNRAQGSD
jgi:integrase